MKIIKRIIIIFITMTVILPKAYANMVITYDAIYNEDNQKYSRQYINQEGNLIKTSSHAVKMAVIIDDIKYTAYCIELGVPIEKNAQANEHDLKEFFSQGISNPTTVNNLIEKINLYTRYGYGNNNMTDDRYYLATQLLIWKAIQETGFYSSDFYTQEYGKNFDMMEYGWVSDDNLDGDWIDLTTEMNNIKLATISHNVTPSLCSSKNKLELEAETSATYVDTNGVLSKYSVTCGDNLTCQIEDNKLYVTANNKTGEDTINFIKKTDGMKNSAYRTDNYQALILANGKLNDITCNFGIDTYKNVKTGVPKLYYVLSLAILFLGFSSIFYFTKMYKTSKG